MAVRARGRENRVVMAPTSLPDTVPPDHYVGIVLVVLILVFLVIALLFPERF